MHRSLTSVPPLAEPLHWVIVAFVGRRGEGVAVVRDAAAGPDALVTVAFEAPGLTFTKLFVTLTLQRSVPPPPLIA